MPEAAFVDANVFLYAGGGPHPLQVPCASVVQLIARNPNAFQTSVEVLQEIAHVLLRRGLVQRARETVALLREILVDRIVDVRADDVSWLLEQAAMSTLETRDRLHLAVMNRLGVRSIVTADKAFDRASGIVRLAPELLPEWRSALGIN
jgi:predicted nucleic acid-binding protein